MTAAQSRPARLSPEGHRWQERLATGRINPAHVGRALREATSELIDDYTPRPPKLATTQETHDG